jgi:Rrf2 family protein
MPDVELNGHSQICGLLDLSSKIEYALLALLELASYPSRKHPLTINQISARQPIPERYLEQILTNLRRGGLIQSQRGSKGGYVLVREPWQITLLEIVTLVQGDRGDRTRDLSTDEQKVIHAVWHQASSSFEAALGQYTLQDLCQKRDAQSQIQPMYYI